MYANGRKSKAAIRGDANQSDRRSNPRRPAGRKRNFRSLLSHSYLSPRERRIKGMQPSLICRVRNDQIFKWTRINLLFPHRAQSDRLRVSGGVKCTIFRNSRSASGGARPLPQSERPALSFHGKSGRIAGGPGVSSCRDQRSASSESGRVRSSAAGSPGVRDTSNWSKGSESPSPLALM